MRQEEGHGRKVEVESIGRPHVPTALIWAAVALALAAGARAARADVDHDFQAWPLAVAQGRIAGPVLGYAEAQLRFSDDASRLQLLLARPAIGYEVAERISLWAGYGYTPRFRPEHVREHRAWQQLLTEHALGPLAVVNRTRLEERFIEGVDGVALRFRHMLRLVLPLTGSKAVSAVVYDEIFYHLNSPEDGPRAGFDQNRAFAGLNFRIAEPVRLEVGYLNQLIARPGPLDELMNHNAVVMLVYSF